MNTEKLTPAQQVFINEMVKGGSQKRANMAAYPGSSAEAAYSSASRLMDKPGIRQRIQDEMEQITWMKQDIMVQQYAETLIAISRQMDILEVVYQADRSRTETITNFKGQTSTRSSLDLRQKLDAIKLHSKLTGQWKKLMGEMTDREVIARVMAEIRPAKGAANVCAAANMHTRPVISGLQSEAAGEGRFFEQAPGMLANVSKSEPEPAVGRQQNEHALPNVSMVERTDIKASGKSYETALDSCCITDHINKEICGHSDEDLLNDSGNSCETLACDSPKDSESDEAPNVGTVTKEPAHAEHRHMNRRQRRAAEQYSKRLAEKEEKLRILMNS